MNPEDYIQSVEEQLRAYDFEPVDIVDQSGYICYRRRSSRIVREEEELVFVTEFKSDSVDDLKSHFDDVVESGKAVFSLDEGMAVRQWYFVAVMRSSTRALRVATERGSKMFSLQDNYRGFLLPVLVDLEQSILKCGDVSLKHKVTHLTEMENKAEEYFKI